MKSTIIDSNAKVWYQQWFEPQNNNIVIISGFDGTLFALSKFEV